jgi:hypothetical protein
VTPATILFVSVSVTVLVSLVLLLRKPSATGIARDPAGALELEDLLPEHSCHYPQIRQALCDADAAFVRQRSHMVPVRAWKKERRAVLQQYLAGLAEDFMRLDALARQVALLSPTVDRQQEMERIWLSARFLCTYRVASLRLRAGSVSADGFRRLTELVGSLACRLDSRMAAALEQASA